MLRPSRAWSLLPVLLALAACDPGPAGNTGAHVRGAAADTPAPVVSPAARLDGRLAKLDGVTGVARKADIDEVGVEVEDPGGALYMTKALDAVGPIAESLRDAPPAARPSELVISLQGETVDRLGHKRVAPFLELSFSGRELAEAQLDNLSYGRRLDLATHYLIRSAAGVDVLQSFCSDEMGRASTEVCGHFNAAARALTE